tara:strand:+ start:253 stop:594 length:342 start_codon:yes stop_codon:yes gene_type:complete
MSDAPTPRTDKVLSECHQRTFDVDVSDLSKMHLHAQHLERQSDQLAKQCVVFVEEIADDRTALANYKAELERLLDEIAELRKDLCISRGLASNYAEEIVKRNETIKAIQGPQS